MWKRTTTKVFLTFSSLIVLVSFALVLSFGRLLVEQREIYIYDYLSSRSRLAAAEIEVQLNKGQALEKMLMGNDFLLLNSFGELMSGKSHFFSAEQLKALKPTSGSLVTRCYDENNNSYLCSFVAIEQNELWLIDYIPEEKFFQTLSLVSEKIAPLVLLFLSITLIIAFILARLILSPLQRFVRATKLIAEGQYTQLELPTHRGDEVGKLSEAFQKMIYEVRDRESNLARTGLKLAHSARLASIGQMGASIAHEIKNPLTSMLGHAKLMLQSGISTDLKESAEIIYKESDRCNQIIQQMLRFSRHESAERKAFSLKELLDSTLLLVKAEASKKKVKINYDIFEDEIVFANPQQTQQVILNLILNAIQAMSEKGNISIKVTSIGQDSVATDIIDNGPGIPTEIRSKIFEPFFTTKDKAEGTGLGLSIAQNLIEDQGGKLELVESVPGRTIFRVRLLKATAKA